MAKLFLEANDTFTLQDDATVFGNSGTETIKISGAPNVELDGNIERIELSGASTDYTYQITGNKITISKDGSPVATINGLNQPADVAFTDGSATLDMTGLNSASLGGTALPTADGAVTPDTINTDDTTTVGETTTDPDPDTGPIKFSSVFTLTENVVVEHSLKYADVDTSSLEELLSYAREYEVAVNSSVTNSDTINVADAADLKDFGVEYLLEVINDFDELQTTTTLLPAVLTTTESNEGVIEGRTTTSGNDYIVAGTPYALHQAYIDGGAGYNALVVDMKGPFAQAKQLKNIQEVQVQNLTNYYDVEGANYDNLFSNVFDHGTANSILDLSRADDLETVVITEGGANGSLTILGMQNYATARFEGSFQEDVTLHYAAGQKDVLNVEMVNVTSTGTIKIAHNVGALELNSGGRSNILDAVNFGTHFQSLAVTGDALLAIEGDLDFAWGEAYIDASENTGGLRVNVSNLGVADLSVVNIMGSQARDVITLDGVADGASINIDTNIGNDTLKIEGNLKAGAGSVITGDTLTVVVDADADLRLADVSGVDAFQITVNGGLFLGLDQVNDVGIENFGAAFETVSVLTIELNESATLSEIIDLSALDSNVRLAFSLDKDATLTLTAEEVHTYLAENAVAGDGNVVITDAGINFDEDDAEIDTANLDVNGDILGEGFGTIVEGNVDGEVHVIRSQDGFERPLADADTDSLIIDTTGTEPLTIDGLDASQVETLIIMGDQDAVFTDTVTLDPAGFTIDASDLSGALVDLTVEDFNNVDEVIGNGAEGLRIDVKLDGDVGAPGADSGLKSSGVEQYVVVETTGAHSFHLCDNTQDVKAVGLQGNAGETVTFTNIPWGQVNPTILLEGDGKANWDELSKADGNPDQSSVGTVVAEYFFDGAPATVLISNQGVAPGLTSTGTARPIAVDGIETVNAASLNITVEDGDAVINSVDSDAEDVTLTSANDITLHLDGDDFDSIDASLVSGDMTLHIDNDTDFSATVLTGIDAMVLENGVEVTLTLDQINAIDADNIVLADENGNAELNIGSYDGTEFDFASLALDGITVGTVTFAAGQAITVDAATDFTDLTEVIIPADTTVEISAAQFQQMVDSGTLITTVAAGANDDEDGAVTVVLDGDLTIGTDAEVTINASNVTFDMSDGETLNVEKFSLADELKVNGDATAATKPVVNFTFEDNGAVPFTATIDVASYQDVDVRIFDTLLNNFWIFAANSQSIEDLLENLDSANILNIYQEEVVVELDPRDREVVVESLAAPNGIEFSAVGSLADYVRSIDLTLEADADSAASIDGDVNVNDGDVRAGYTMLTINAVDTDGAATDAVTIVGDIKSENPGAGNAGELLSVTINAEHDIEVQGTIIFNSEAAEDNAEATLTLQGSGDITIDALDVTVTDIDTLNIVNNATGTVTVPGASAALEMLAGVDGNGDSQTSSLVISGTGSEINFGTAEDPDTADLESNSGFFIDDITTINAAAYEGDLNLGIVTGNAPADSAFSITGSQGVTTLTLGAADDNDDNAVDNAFTMTATSDVTIDLSASAAGSSVTLSDQAALPDMTGTAAADAGSLTILAETLVIEGNVDFRVLVDTDDNNKLDLTAVTEIEVAEGGSLQMSDAQWNALTTDQKNAITGDGLTLQVTADDIDGTIDNFIDLTDVRGVTAIQVDEALVKDLVFTVEQAAIITTGTFDVDGVFTATQWDHDTNAGTDEISRDAGDLRDYAGKVVVLVEGEGQDVSDLLGLTDIRIVESAAADTVLTVTNDQVDEVSTGTFAADVSAFAADVLAETSSLTVEIDVDTGNTDIDGNPVIVSSSFEITNDGTTIDATGNASAIGTAQLGLNAVTVNALLGEAATVTWNSVGTTASMTLAAGAANDLTGTDNADDFVFAANVDTDPVSYLVIGEFDEAVDTLDVSAWADVGTLAASDITNDVNDNSFIVSAVATTVYVIDTDNHPIDGGIGPNFDIIDFTDLVEVGAFLDGVSANDTAGEVHYFVINDSGFAAGDAWMYRFTDAGGNAAIDAAELVLLGKIDSTVGIAAADFTV